MPRPWCAVAFLTVALAAPTPYVLRIRLDAAPGLSAESARVEAALRRGFYVDSLVVLGNAASRPSQMPPREDSVAWANVTRTVLVQGSILEYGQNLEVRLQLVDILGRSIVGPDTLRVDRDGLDSAVVAEGRRFAQTLTKKRR